MQNLTTLQKIALLGLVWLLMQKGGTTPPSIWDRPTDAVYVWEQDKTGAVPNHVLNALDKLNARTAPNNIDATNYEVWPDQTPQYYQAALAAAKQVAGVDAQGYLNEPVFVVLAKKKVIRTVKNPQTEAQVLEAVPP